MSYDNRGTIVSNRIYWLFSILDTPTYDEVAPKIAYWIELALTQQLTTVDQLVEHVSRIAWTRHSSASFARFLQEFRDSPRRSAQARSFVIDLCTRIFRWFAAASTEDLVTDWNSCSVAMNGGCGFVEAASSVGNLTECGLLDHGLVRLHLIKPLTAHYYSSPETLAEPVRANAICQLFAVAGSTLVHGLLEPEDVQVCFELLEIHLSRYGMTMGLSRTKLEV